MHFCFEGSATFKLIAAASSFVTKLQLQMHPSTHHHSNHKPSRVMYAHQFQHDGIVPTPIEDIIT
ncbi:hypothetical protein EJB05_03023 [Eragrostis curvula]|uniref:Uncharacterized protein n=1 Tax=Eragrostis curvula TaxID=38414 RepID=A0A5J9WUU1_9POAL|nr:hypothetical protein EJB05_03023 [Eragrostis curvula]